MTRRVRRFYFAFRSPYAWIGARLLEEYCNPVESGIEYRPFWEPDRQTLALLEARGGEFIYTPMSRQKHLYILQDIKRLTTRLGYAMQWPVDPEHAWWDLPHLAYLVAQRHGKGHQFFWAVYRARWEEGRDICAVATIRDLATVVGLDPDLLAVAPDDPAIRQEGAEALYQCYRDGVFGIPFFIDGRDKFWGVDRFVDFITRLEQQDGRIRTNIPDLLRRLYGPPAPKLPDVAPSSTRARLEAHGTATHRDAYAYDRDHAGGCG